MAVWAWLPVLAACGSESSTSLQGLATGTAEQAFINGSDDRREYFELTDEGERTLIEQSIVALVPDAAARQLYRGNLGVVPTWGESSDLCPGEPFDDQPSAAFCSGVLVDWDLVLTSGHCVNILPLSNLRIVFGFYFREPGELALAREDVYRVKEVVAARDDESPEERIDFGWLRLAEPVRAPHVPAAVRSRAPEVELGDAIISINAGGGVPFKLDAGARVRDLREGTGDYFVADTDTSEGSSGGAAFNAELAVVGTLARGAPDFILTQAGCLATDQEPDPLLATEQFTYADRSVEGLCEVEPDHWLCDTSCETPCEPPPLPAAAVPNPNDGCSVSSPAPMGSTPHGMACVGLALGAAFLRRTVRRRTAS